jgi:hypothetical protein
MALQSSMNRLLSWSGFSAMAIAMNAHTYRHSKEFANVALPCRGDNDGSAVVCG